MLHPSWMSAGAAAAVVVALGGCAAPPPPADGAATAPTAAACPANAPKANLNFTLDDTNGRPVNLSQYRGKVLLLDFWATWCVPCKVEIPAFIELYKTLKPKGFEAAGVVVLDQFSKAPAFARQYGMNYPVLNGVDRADIEDAYGPLFALPTSILIARDGRICGRHVGLPKTKTPNPSVKDVMEVFGAEIRALL